MKFLKTPYFLDDDVVALAKNLLGKILITGFEGKITSGRIVETEAYAGETDRASHASKGRTPRSSVMFNEGGIAYIYLCYGIHQMFNIVTAKEGLAHAILIRAVEPIEGIDIMLERTGKTKQDYTLTKGPGNVGKAFGFHTSKTGSPVTSGDIRIADDGYKIPGDNIIASPRIGVDYAGDHALWPYRFYIKSNPWVSGKKNQ